MAIAVSKRETSRNPLADWVVSVIQFVQTYRTPVLAGLAAVVILAVAAGGYVWYQGRRGGQARKSLAAAMLALRSDTGAPTPAPPKTDEAMKLLQQVADQYRGTEGAEEALIRLGNLNADANKPDAAADAYGRYLREYPRGRFAMMAAIGRSYALESKGDLDGAAQTLSRAVEQSPDSPLAGEAYATLGRIYESQKKPEAATKIYNQIIEKFPATQWAAQATFRLGALRSK